MKNKGTMLVTGATGKQGGAVIKHLLASGWTVCAPTRKLDSDKPNALRRQGVDVVGGGP